jgi:O-antigen ligase
LQIGAVAVVVAATTLHAFELDRFFVPKELVLHLVAIAAGWIATRVAMTRVDLLLAAYLLLGAISAAFATNPWVAVRAVAISASSAIVFWTARVLRERGQAQALLNALAVAVIAAAVTSLLQTYGVETTLFSEQRAPGGTLGNRNFVAHVAAFGLPLVLLAALRARMWAGWAAGAALVVGTLVLTRSRAAWLAFGAVLLVFLIAMLASAPLRRSGRTWMRLAAVILFAGGGVAAAMLLPNALRWNSNNPYLESLERVADYREGSGRGRLVQYERSLRMSIRHPLLGVGPGNWPVVYPEHAARNDPSMNDSEPGTTFNPWPSSDWIAWISERGLAAVVLIALVFVGIAFSAVKQLIAAQQLDEALPSAALLGVIAGAGVTGLFDAVLLLALPALIVWAALGALWSAGVPPADRTAPPSQPPPRRAVVIAILIVSLVGLVRSASQLTAMQIYATSSDRTSLARAAQIDPANYRLRLRLARMGGKRKCEHALAAHALYPSAQAARAMSRRCE